MPKPPAVYRIACLGGSTTYGDGVDDWRLTYPALLQDSLRAWGVSEVEVVNAGVPGYSSYESVINLEFRVLDLHPDLVFFYEAINDVYPRLVWPPSAYLGDNSGFLGDKWPFEGPSLLERSTLARAIMIKLHLILPQPTLSRASGLQRRRRTPSGSASSERTVPTPRGHFAKCRSGPCSTAIRRSIGSGMYGR